MWANFQRIIELFTQKLSLSSQKYGFGIRDPEKTLFRIPNPQHWLPHTAHTKICSSYIFCSSLMTKLV